MSIICLTQVISKVISYLLNKVEEQGVEIRYNTKVQTINDEHKVITEQGDAIEADLIISAIAPFDYKDIQLQENQTGSLDADKVHAALDHLYPSDMTKLVLQLTDKVNIDHLDHVEMAENFLITTDGESDVVYLSVWYDYFHDKVVEAALNHIQELYNKPNIAIKEVKTHYTDGNSWYKQSVGFDPVLVIKILYIWVYSPVRMIQYILP
jgi:predicted flavoprotein YhiN